MADSVTIHVRGLKELQQALSELPKRVNSNALRSAVNAGAAVIRAEARKNAPVYTGDVQNGHPPPGTLRKSIITKYIPELSTSTRKTFFVTVRHGKKYQKVKGRNGSVTNLDAFYWWWVEKGTAKMTARPYLRPAFYAHQNAAVSAIKYKLGARIDIEATKLANKK
jgi:HK97 gp10 family phage protein